MNVKSVVDKILEGADIRSSIADSKSLMREWMGDPSERLLKTRIRANKYLKDWCEVEARESGDEDEYIEFSYCPVEFQNSREPEYSIKAIYADVYTGLFGEYRVEISVRDKNGYNEIATVTCDVDNDLSALKAVLDKYAKYAKYCEDNYKI